MPSENPTLETYLATKTEARPAQDEPGVESGWLKWGNFRHDGGKVRVIDISMFASEGEGVDVNLPAGEYDMEVKMIAFGSDRRTAGFRVARAGSSMKRGKEIGEVGIDAGKLCLFSQMLGTKLAKGERSAEFKSLVDEAREKRFVFGRVEGGSFASLDTGFGDGGYPVYEMKGGGFEIEFLESSVRYPFETPNVSPEQEASEKLHWEKIEHLWDPAFEAMKKSLADARAYFAKLTPGERALLAIDIFNKILIRLGPQAFLTNSSSRVVADEVGRGYELLGAKDYGERAKVFLASIPSIEPTASGREKVEATRAHRQQHGREMWDFFHWFQEEMNSTRNPIEKRIVAYVGLHPEEFGR